MISLILLAFALLIGAWTVYSCYCLYCNYRIACKIGIPLRVIPISHENPLWMVVDKKIFIPIFERFPFGSGNFTRYNWRGWEFTDKYRSHMEMGDVFMLVTPGRNWLYLCNAESLVDVFQRRSDFPRPLEIFGILFFVSRRQEEIMADEIQKWLTCLDQTYPRYRVLSRLYRISLTLEPADRRSAMAEASKDHRNRLQRTKQCDRLGRKRTPRKGYGSVLEYKESS